MDELKDRRAGCAAATVVTGGGGREPTFAPKQHPSATHLAEAMVLQVLERQLHDWVHILCGMRVLAVGTLTKPLSEVDSLAQ